MSTYMRKTVTIVCYERGIPVAKWRIWPEGDGSAIEQTTLRGFSELRMANNLLMILEELVDEMWKADIQRLLKNNANNLADQEFDERRRMEDEPPF